jgi:hypothetical protein
MIILKQIWSLWLKCEFYVLSLLVLKINRKITHCVNVRPLVNLL